MITAALDDPQLLWSGLIEEVVHPQAGRHRSPGPWIAVATRGHSKRVVTKVGPFHGLLIIAGYGLLALAVLVIWLAVAGFRFGIGHIEL